MPETERNMSPDHILGLLTAWLRRKLTPRPPLSYHASTAMLDNLRQALRDNATPVGAAPSPQPDPAFTVRSAARSAEIVGHMMDAMSDKYAVMKNPAAFFVKMGRITWALVEAAIPRSVANLLMRYWFTLLLIVEIVMILGSTFVAQEKTVQALGVKLLALTLLFRAAVEIVGLYLRRLRAPGWAGVVLVSAVLVVFWRGVVHVQDDDIPAIEKRLSAAKQNYLCGWLRCESPKPGGK
jgi:hypothetical protein